MDAPLIKIRNYTYITLGVYLALLAGAALLSLTRHLPGEANRLNSFLGLMGSVCFSAAFPILIRLYFYNRSRKEQGMDYPLFGRMKICSLLILGAGILFIVYSIIKPIYRYHLYISVLAGIYGIYSLLPFKENLIRDIKSFGVVQNDR